MIYLEITADGPRFTACLVSRSRFAAIANNPGFSTTIERDEWVTIFWGVGNPGSPLSMSTVIDASAPDERYSLWQWFVTHDGQHGNDRLVMDTEEGLRWRHFLEPKADRRLELYASLA